MCGHQVSVEKQAVLLSNKETVSLGRCIPNHGTLLHLSLVISIRLCLLLTEHPTSEAAGTDEHIHYTVAVWSVAWAGGFHSPQCFPVTVSGQR